MPAGTGVCVVNTVRPRAFDRLASGRARWRTPGQLERRQRGVALVEVDDDRLTAHRPQRPDPADAEQRVLGQARLGVAVVQAAR